MRKQRNTRWHFFISGCILSLSLLLAACGSGSSTTGGSSNPAIFSAAHQPAQASGSSAGSASSSSSSSPAGQGTSNIPIAQYLIKTLNVSMSVKDTQKIANDLQNWITTTDPRAYSAGITYNQVGNNLYNISLTFSVETTLYPQIEQYLTNYPAQHGGQLLSLNETVQDVTNDYIDTQSRLTNLKSEQTRLLDLMSHAQALGDIISIQDRLTQVEGDIEQIEAHLKELSSQTSYYTVVIGLQPLEGVTPPPPNTPTWNIGQIFHDAFAASLAFAQGLLSVLIWLLAFLIYIIPVAIIAWLVLRWRRRTRVVSATHIAGNQP